MINKINGFAHGSSTLAHVLTFSSPLCTLCIRKSKFMNLDVLHIFAALQ
jgi:hypothetical protein